MRYEIVKLQELKHGDQIAVMGNVADLSPLLSPFTVLIGDTYYHHGIFDKENIRVIDFYGESKANARPQKRDFTEFFAGHTTLYRVVYESGDQCLPVSQTMKMAEDAVKKQSSWPGYDLIKNNCESFATYLKTGVARSKQALDALIRAAPVAAVVIGTGLTSSPVVVGATGAMAYGASAYGASGKRTDGSSGGSLAKKSK